MPQEIVRITLRVPRQECDYMDRVADENVTSRNAEIVRSIRERMQAAAGDEFGDQAPAAASRTNALQGVNSITNGKGTTADEYAR